MRKCYVAGCPEKAVRDLGFKHVSFEGPYGYCEPHATFQIDHNGGFPVKLSKDRKRVTIAIKDLKR